MRQARPGSASHTAPGNAHSMRWCNHLSDATTNLGDVKSCKKKLPWALRSGSPAATVASAALSHYVSQWRLAESAAQNQATGSPRPHTHPHRVHRSRYRPGRS